MITMGSLNTDTNNLESVINLDTQNINVQTIPERELEPDYTFEQMVSGPSPCDQCMNANACKNNNLACRDFLYFVEQGEVRNLDRHALRRIYIKIYCNENGDNLTEENIQEIKFLNSIRGMTHNMIANKFYVLPLKVRQIVESK